MQAATCLEVCCRLAGVRYSCPGASEQHLVSYIWAEPMGKDVFKSNYVQLHTLHKHWQQSQRAQHIMLCSSAANCKTSKVLSKQAATCLEVCCIAAEMRSAVVRLLLPILCSITVDVQPHQQTAVVNCSNKDAALQLALVCTKMPHSKQSPFEGIHVKIRHGPFLSSPHSAAVPAQLLHNAMTRLYLCLLIVDIHFLPACFAACHCLLC